MPVLRTRKALRRLRPGERLIVLCTDPLAGLDIPNLLRENGDSLDDQAHADGVTRFVIIKGRRPDDRWAADSQRTSPNPADL